MWAYQVSGPDPDDPDGGAIPAARSSSGFSSRVRMTMLPASTSLSSVFAASLAGSTSARSAYTTNQRSTTRIVSFPAFTSRTLMMYGAVTELRTISSSRWSEPATSRNAARWASAAWPSRIRGSGSLTAAPFAFRPSPRTPT